jgi:hypothetical protein
LLPVLADVSMYSMPLLQSRHSTHSMHVNQPGVHAVSLGQPSATAGTWWQAPRPHLSARARAFSAPTTRSSCGKSALLPTSTSRGWPAAFRRSSPTQCCARRKLRSLPTSNTTAAACAPR